MSSAAARVGQIAGRLAARAGLEPVAALKPLAGGRNNRVYRIRHDGDALSVLKLYHVDPRDPRDRLAHEWAFLAHAQACGASGVPAPLARDEDEHAALYSHAPGRKLRPAQVDAAWVDRAVDFVAAMNRRRAGPGMPDASEACFSLEQHVATIDRRVERLADLEVAPPHGAGALDLVRRRLQPAWAAVKASIRSGAARAGLDMGLALPESARIASPSDFGFHNALVDGAAITFLDFEYAGWDDPAKLVSDFFCQPERPAPSELHGRFVRRLVDELGLDAQAADRCRLLLDGYRVKWACIVLNDFLPLGATRRAFAKRPLTAARGDAQLRRAASLIDAVTV